MSTSSRKLLAVIRIRGTAGVPKDVEDTLKMLRLVRKHHCVIIDNRPSYLGMLQKVKDYVTWGEIDAETLALLLRRRGRLRGNTRLTDDHVKKLGYENIEQFAKAVLEGKARLDDIPGLKPVFRLAPPSGGFKGTIKKPYKAGGELGYRGSAINDLLKRMA
ncbi:MAG: 50S ribosomal protein L30 [Thermoprotei archaeon]|nr:MAG: 50S ribosomal protein L30 [Thermoprotei archaeon]RLF24450.1 MAG: 50S ribosomal protein L30 [Thermoprotei archaeon]